MTIWRARKKNSAPRSGRSWIASGLLIMRDGMMRGGAVLVVALSMIACGSSSEDPDDGPINKTTTFQYSSTEEAWVKKVSAVIAPSEEESSHDIIIQLDKDEPVKGIILRQVLLLDSSSTSAELKIGGSCSTTDGVTTDGVIRICNLVFLDVEAKDFDVNTTDVVRLDMVNVSTENNIDIEVTPSNTITCGRGGTSVLSLGEEIPFQEEQVEIGLGGQVVSLVTTSGRQGLRATRIHILGPSGETGYIENLIIEGCSVFGNIKLNDLEIQELFLKNLTVDSQ